MTEESGRPVPLRYYEVSAQALMLELVEGNATRVVEGIPRGADLRDAGYDPERQVFYLTVEHEDFDPVHEAEPIPKDTATMQEIRPFIEGVRELRDDAASVEGEPADEWYADQLTDLLEEYA